MADCTHIRYVPRVIDHKVTVHIRDSDGSTVISIGWRDRSHPCRTIERVSDHTDSSCSGEQISLPECGSGSPVRRKIRCRLEYVIAAYFTESDQPEINAVAQCSGTGSDLWLFAERHPYR